MASTYVNDLRLNEMGTGDGSGTWGTTTNTNLELIAEAFSYGTEGITTNADTHSTTIADGATDPGRSLYVKYTGTLDSTCTVSLLPNTVSKLWIIENATSGGFNLSIKQGSGAEIVIPSGDVKVVYSDGAGAGAAIFDALVDLNIATKLTLKNPATSASPATVLLQTGDTDIAVNDVLGKIQFQAPDEGTGTDAILVAAEVAAVSEGDFSSSNNATKLSFKTGASEAATEKMSLSSGGNLTLPTDGVVIAAGVNSDVTLTHVHDTGLLLNSTMALQFNDASQYINAPDGTTLDINATDEVEINATLIDLNGSVDITDISATDIYKAGGNINAGRDSAGTYAETSARGFYTYYSADTYTRVLVRGSASNSSVWEAFVGGAVKSQIEADGDFESATNSYGAVSDARLKENVVDSPSQWNDVKAMRIRKYSFISDNLDSPNMLGVVAQELEASGMSGLVKTKPNMRMDANGNDIPVLDSDGNATDYKSVKSSIIHMKAVKALQEAMARIETLEAKVAVLEG
tara:strand:+ start:3046 stop:4599 length:1554 start_codon:yes stop_codon:yes gene_type:complete